MNLLFRSFKSKPFEFPNPVGSRGGGGRGSGGRGGGGRSDRHGAAAAAPAAAFIAKK